MIDEIQNKTDAQLNELFAIEVAGMVRRHIGSKMVHMPDDNRCSYVLDYCTDANAVLPYAAKHRIDIEVHDDGVSVGIFTLPPFASLFLQTSFTEDETPKGWRNRHPEPADICRAIVVALIAAKRVELP